MVLKGVKLADNGLDNPIGVSPGQSTNGVGFGDGIVDNEFLTLSASSIFSNGGSFPANDPYGFQSYYNFSQGLFPDGSIKYAPNGTPIKHDFFGTSDPSFYSSEGIDHGNNLSEITLGNNPGDRRIIACSGSGVLNAGDTSDYLVAYITSFDSVNISVQNSIAQLFADASYIKNAFMTNNVGCGSTFGTIQEDLSTAEIEKYDVLIYPNPFNGSFRISNLGNSATQISVMDVNGKVVFESATNQNMVEIPLEVKSGIYLVHVTNELGSVVKRLVRN